MKKILLLAIMAITTISANAQNEDGAVYITPRVGLSFATTTNAGSPGWRTGLNAGVEAEYNLSENCGVSGGLFYTMQGAKVSDLTLKLDYINVPILFRYSPVEGLYFKAGLQPGFNVVSDFRLYGETVKIEETVKTVALSIPIGVSYMFRNHIALDFRYNWGITKAYGDNCKNSVFMLTAGYSFQL